MGSRTSPSTRTRVLILESHDDTRELYAQFLAASGFSVVPVATSDEALARATDVAAVITGIAVHGSFDGMAFIERLRADGRFSRTPIVVVTAHAFPEYRDRALAAGADAFLAKPCEPERLRDELARVLTVARRRRAARARPRSRSRARAS